ncbi:hypothetical protein [Sedimenticola sp.]
MVAEDDGTLGIVCIYQGVGAATIQKHIQRTGLPDNEITEVVNMLIIHQDPVIKLRQPDLEVAIGTPHWGVGRHQSVTS